MNAKTARRFVIEKAKWMSGLPYRRRASHYWTLSDQDFWEYQHRQFLAVYKDAVVHVPYYRETRNYYPSELEPRGDLLSTLRQLPVLPKSIVKADTERFWRKPALFGTNEHTTGGTTGGAGLRLKASLAERGFTNAILESRYQRLVGTKTPRVVRMTGYITHKESEGSLIEHIPGTNIAYLSIYSLTPKNRDEIASFLATFKPQVIHGYPSAIHQLALLFPNGSLPELKTPFVVISNAEKLLSHHRRDIEANLRTKVFDEYGSQEGQHLVFQCECGAMHIHPGRGIIEILKLDADIPAEKGELGRVVVTGLANRSMPLLRYDIGDNAWSTGYASNCDCGLGWPTIGAVDGRIDDHLRTRDGQRFRLMTISVDGVTEAQLVQKGYERFVYRAVLDDPARADTDAIESQVSAALRDRMNTSVEVAFEYLDALERTTSGKLRSVIVDMGTPE